MVAKSSNVVSNLHPVILFQYSSTFIKLSRYSVWLEFNKSFNILSNSAGQHSLDSSDSGGTGSSNWLFRSSSSSCVNGTDVYNNNKGL